MKQLTLLGLALSLGGCAVASTALDVATMPVKGAKTAVNVASAGVDVMTTSQSELDEKRGREARKADEKRGRELRAMDERCRRGRALATDNCQVVRQR